MPRRRGHWHAGSHRGVLDRDPGGGLVAPGPPGGNGPGRGPGLRTFKLKIRVITVVVHGLVLS